MADPKVLFETVGDVAILRLNDPSVLNAVTLQMLDELADAAQRSAREARAMVLTGAGRAFCAGANLASGLGAAPADMGAALESHINPLMRALKALPIPWITAVRGAAAGVGCSLALAADLIIAGDGAYFLQAFAQIGLIPDGGSTWLLTRAAGRARAMEMMLLGERLPAAKALEWGLINRVVDDDALDAAALDLAQTLARGPTRTLGLIREAAWAAADQTWEQSLDSERRLQRDAGQTADFREGVTAFLQKRPAVFKGA